VVSYLNGSFTF